MVDGIVEGTELFTVSVISTDIPGSILNVDPATQTAVITDNSSEVLIHYGVHFCSVCCLTGVTVLFESVALTVAENDSFVE